MSIVLDSSALLAIVHGEPGADRVEESLAEAAMSAVNYQEVVSKLTEGGLDPDQIQLTLAPILPALHPHDAPQALAAGLLRRATRAAGLSLGDRACLALALALGAPVLTADRGWAGLDVGAEIEVIR